jgi:hypothetical protein
MKINPRRPFYDDQPNGMVESDQDFVNNNLEACVALLEAKINQVKPNYSGLEKMVERLKQGLRYPTFCGCMECSGLVGFTESGITLTKDEAVSLNFMQLGARLQQSAGQMKNTYISLPRPCSCDHNHDWGPDAGRVMFEHIYTCKICGVTVNVDSSG